MTASATKPSKKSSQQQQHEATNRPVHEVRLGRIRAAIWANSTEAGIRHNVTITRLYKDDKSGEWRDSQSFGRDDLPLVGKVCDIAHSWIYSQSNSNGGEGK